MKPRNGFSCKTGRWVFVGMLIGATSACGDEGGGTESSWDVDVGELREVFRIGGIDVPEEERFQREPEIAVGRDGSLFVLHHDLGRIAVFDTEGRFQRWVGGGRGQGPGEFTLASGLGFVADTLWVRNLTPPRISRFLANGAYVGSDDVLMEVDYRTTMGIQGITGYLQDGYAWAVPDGFIIRRDGTEQRAPLIIGTREMSARSSVLHWRPRRGRLSDTAFEAVPEPPFYHVAPDGSGVLVGEWSEDAPQELVVRRVAPDGSEARSWRFTFPGTPISTAVRDSIVEAAREHLADARNRMLEQGVPRQLLPSVLSPDQIEDELFLPAYRPPVGDVRAGLDGTTWLHVWEDGRPGPWVVLDPEGTPLFRLALPAGAELRHGSREGVWATMTDELDVPYVLHWSIE